MAIDFRLKNFFYPRRILHFRRLFEKTQWWEPRRLQAYQEEQLARILRHACLKVPYYRDLFARLEKEPEAIKGVEDLSTLPSLGRRTVREERDRLVAEDVRRWGAFEARTSGSTGQPLRFFLDRDCQALEFAYYWRHWSWAGYRLGDPFAELNSVFFLNRPRKLNQPFHFQPLLNRLLINTTQLSLDRVEEMVRALWRYRPRFLKGIASALYHFAQLVRRKGLSCPPLQGVFSGGEVLTPQFRRGIEETFQVPLLDSYGHMERTVAISQCPRGGYHVNTDYGVLEIESDHSPGLGRALGTSLYNRAMPLIRYELEDEIETHPSPYSCPCGRTLPLVRAVHGRRADTIVTPDGRLLTSLFLLPEFLQGLCWLQLVQEREDQVSVLLVTEDGWTGEQEERLRSLLRNILGPRMRFRLNRCGEKDLIRTPSGKIRSVISLLRVQEAPSDSPAGETFRPSSGS